MIRVRPLAILGGLLLLAIPAAGLPGTIQAGPVSWNSHGLPPTQGVRIGYECHGVGVDHTCSGDPLTRGWVWASTCASHDDLVCSDLTATLRLRVGETRTHDVFVEATFVAGRSVLRGHETVEGRACEPLSIDVLPAQVRAPPREGSPVSTGAGPTQAAWHVWVEETWDRCTP